MMVNGPWNFSGLALAHMYYGKQFGIVPVPVPCARPTRRSCRWAVKTG